VREVIDDGPSAARDRRRRHQAPRPGAVAGAPHRRARSDRGRLHRPRSRRRARPLRGGTGNGARGGRSGGAGPGRPRRGRAVERGSIPVAGPGLVSTRDELASGAGLLRRLGGDAAEVLGRAAAGEPAVVAALRAAGEALGLGLATVINLLNPSLLALGGGALELPGYLDAALQEAERHSLPDLWRACEVRRVRQGVLAAALRALRAITAELV